LHWTVTIAREALRGKAEAVPRGWLAAVAFASIVLFALVPVLAVKLPPLVDLLGHVGRYAIQTGLNDHPELKQYYSFHWRLIGNLGADILIQLLAPFAAVETSAHMIVVMTQGIAAGAVLLLCREIHQRITPFCLFALTLIYSLPFNYGFLNFTLSMALALLAFTLWLRLERTGRHRARTWLFLPIGLVLWLCHTYGWAFLGLLCTAESLVHSRKKGRDWLLVLWDTGWRCLPLAAPLLPMLLWRNQAGGRTEGWFLIDLKLNWLLSMLRLDDVAIDRLSAAVLFGLVYFGLRSPRIVRDRRMVAAAALCLLAFVVLPLRLFGSFYADMRLAPYMTIIALLAFDDRPLRERPRRWLMTAAVAFLAVRIALTTVTYVERERSLNSHLEALHAIPEGARVATLVSLPCPSDWKLPLLTHLGSMAIARKHVFANDQWATSGMNLLSVHYPPAGAFAHDSSEITYPRRCGENAPTLKQAVAALPVHAFTHLWVLGVPPRAQPPRAHLTLVWRGPDSAVYRIGSPASAERSERASR
jgi:hypothetical protein